MGLYLSTPHICPPPLHVPGYKLNRMNEKKISGQVMKLKSIPKVLELIFGMQINFFGEIILSTLLHSYRGSVTW